MKTPTPRAAPRNRNVKAHAMWAAIDARPGRGNIRQVMHWRDLLVAESSPSFRVVPVFVLPADAESYERMVEQMAQSLWDSLEDSVSDVLTPRKWRGRACRQDEISYRLTAARAALRAIGIKPPAATTRRVGRGAT